MKKYFSATMKIILLLIFIFLGFLSSEIYFIRESVYDAKKDSIRKIEPDTITLHQLVISL